MAGAATGAGPTVKPSPAAAGKPDSSTGTTSAAPTNPRPGTTQVGNQTPSPLWLAMKQAMTTAQNTKQKTPVDAATNSYVTLDANPDGSFTADQSLLPQRTQQNGAWVPIDTTLTVGADQLIHPKAGLENIALSVGGTTPLAVEDDKSGHVLTLTWPNPLPAPTISSDTATYQNIYPGVDLQMTVTRTGLRDQLVVHSATAAANPALKTISIGYAATGLTLTSTAGGGLSAVDAGGKVIFASPTPQMWDSATANARTGAPAITSVPTPNELPHHATLPATVSAGKISISPDAKVLSGHSTVYPVTIDPTWSENAQNWIEIWSNITAPNLDPYDGNPWPYSPYDTSAVRVGNTAGTKVRSLLSFNSSFLPQPGSPTYGPPPIYIIQANLNLTAQSAVCPSTQVWRANPFTPNSNWANQDSPELWPSSGADFTNPLTTIGGSTSCAGHGFTINDTTQVRDVYAAGGATFTVGLRAANESSTTNNYGSFYVQNYPGAANLSVTFVAEPSLGTLSVGNSWIGNNGQQVNACTTGYLPMQSSTIPVSAPLYELDSNRWLTYSIYVSGGAGEVAPYYTSGSTTQADGQLGTSASTVANAQTVGSSALADGQTYTVWMDALDGHWEIDGQPGPNADQYTVPLHDAWMNGGNNYPAPHSTTCTFQAAFSPPEQPTLTSTDLPAPGQQIATGYPTVGKSGTVYVNATAPHTPIDHFDWALNTTSTNEGVGHCGNPVPAGIACGSTGAGSYNALSVSNAPIAIPTSGEHWGNNYLYVSAVDKAGNVSPYARYDFFLAQAWQPVSFGNVSGDGIPDLMGTDTGGNLVTYQANLDPTPGASSLVAGSTTGATAPNMVQAAAASAGPNVVNGAPTWSGALYTHRGAERVQPTDDLFGWGHGSDGNGHLYYYFNAVHLSVPTPAGQNPNPPADAFTQTQQALVTRPTCTPSALNGGCVGYDPTWNSVQQIVALGPVLGGCTITAPTTACKTNLITVESYPPGSPARVWLFSPAGVGQLRNPMLLSVSQPGTWDWSTSHLMAPGNAAGHSGGAGGLPDLWATDKDGTLWQFINRSDTGTMGAGLGDITAKTMLGTAGEFKAYRSTLQPDTDPAGAPDLWAMTPDDQFIALTGPINQASGAPLSATVTTPTAIGWGSTAGVSNLQGVPVTGTLNGQIISDVTGGPSGQKCLDDLNGATASGSIVDIYDCNGTFAQQWTFSADGTIRTMGTTPASPPNACLDTSGSLVLATKITLAGCDLTRRAAFQTWRIIPSPTTTGRYWIYNPAAGLCLDDTGYGTANGAQFQLWQCTDLATNPNAAQRFTLPAGTGQTQSVEAENLGSPWGSNSGGTMSIQTNCCGVSWSNGAQLMLANSAQGSTMTLSYYVANPGLYQVVPVMTKAVDYGQVTLTVDNAAQPLPTVFDGYQSSGASTTPVHFGALQLAAGTHSFTFKATGTNPASTGNRYNLGVDVLALAPTSTTGPNAALNVSPAGIINLPVAADASASFPGTATITSYTFDYGDGTIIGPQPNPTASHAYTSTGTFQVKVTVTDANSATAITSSAITISNGPTSWWKLADGSGTTAADTGNPGGHPATATGNALLTAAGYAIFDGATGENLATSTQVIDTSKSFTVSAWAKLDDLNAYYPVAVQAGNTSFGFWLGYDHNLNSWALTTIQADANQTAWYSAAGASGSAQIGVWTHLVGTFDTTTGKLSLYVNGVLQSRQDTWPTPFTAPGSFMIGDSKGNGSLSAAFKGTIADVSVYQQALNAAEATSLYHNSGFNPPVNLAAGARATASSYTTGWEPSHLTDGILRGSSTNLAWSSNLDSSANATEWAQIDLGASRSINEIDLWPRDDTGVVYCFPTAFTIATSTDGTTWTTVVSKSGYPAPADSAQTFPIALTNGRYIKVTGTSLSVDNNNNHYMQLQQITVMGTNLAAGAKATASSYTQGWEPYHLTDGIYRGTTAVPGYASANDSGATATEWTQIDLGAIHNLNEVDLFPRDEASNTIGACFPVDFTIAVSTDATNWTTVITETGYPKPGDSPQQFPFSQISARYVKLTATKLSTDQNSHYYLELRQIGAFGN